MGAASCQKERKDAPHVIIMGFKQTRGRRRWLQQIGSFFCESFLSWVQHTQNKMASSQKYWVSLVEWPFLFFLPSACSPLFGWKSHNPMPPGPGEGSCDSYWVSHFNQFILEMSMPSNWVQLGWALWFAQELLERNPFLLAELHVVYSSWHVTDIFGREDGATLTCDWHLRRVRWNHVWASGWKDRQ